MSVMDWACAVIAAPSTIVPATMDVIDGFISGLSFPAPVGFAAPFGRRVEFGERHAQGQGEFRSH